MLIRVMEEMFQLLFSPTLAKYFWKPQSMLGYIEYITVHILLVLFFKVISELEVQKSKAISSFEQLEC